MGSKRINDFNKNIKRKEYKKYFNLFILLEDLLQANDKVIIADYLQSLFVECV